MNLPNKRVIRTSKKTGYIIYTIRNDGYTYPAKYRGKILKCKNCGIYYFILNCTYKRNKLHGYCSNCVYKGKNSGKWKGGKKKTNMGYVLVKNLAHPIKDSNGYVLEHRLVMEKFLGRYLYPKEVIHHIDNNKENNKISNLMLFSSYAEHKKYHKRSLNGRFMKG